MTELLEQAIAKLKTLSSNQQDAIAAVNDSGLKSLSFQLSLGVSVFSIS
jgi:hypothetical protein